ncbi:MAG: hypothetical protein WDM96_15390 [Lacunisphaera sp.]
MYRTVTTASTSHVVRIAGFWENEVDGSVRECLQKTETEEQRGQTFATPTCERAATTTSRRRPE